MLSVTAGAPPPRPARQVMGGHRGNGGNNESQTKKKESKTKHATNTQKQQKPQKFNKITFQRREIANEHNIQERASHVDTEAG